MDSLESMTKERGGRTPFEPAFTVILFALGAVSLFNVLTLQLAADVATANSELELLQIRDVLRFVQMSALLFAAAYCVVGVLRVRASAFARSGTALLSALSLLVFPFGTAAFVYWLGWVRKREKASLDASDR